MVSGVHGLTANVVWDCLVWSLVTTHSPTLRHLVRMWGELQNFDKNFFPLNQSECITDSLRAPTNYLEYLSSVEWKCLHQKRVFLFNANRLCFIVLLSRLWGRSIFVRCIVNMGCFDVHLPITSACNSEFCVLMSSAIVKRKWMRHLKVGFYIGGCISSFGMERSCYASKLC